MDNEKFITPIDRDLGPGYMTISIPVKRETAIHMFEFKYSSPPEEVNFSHEKYWMLGPVSEGVDNG